MQEGEVNLQTQNNGTFYRPTVWNAQGLLRTEGYIDEGLTCENKKSVELLEKVSHLARDNFLNQI